MSIGIGELGKFENGTFKFRGTLVSQVEVRFFAFLFTFSFFLKKKNNQNDHDFELKKRVTTQFENYLATLVDSLFTDRLHFSLFVSTS